MRLIKLLLAALVAAFALLACSGGNSPEGVATAFTTAAYKGEADKALALIHIPEGTRATEKEAAFGKMRMLLAMAKEQADNKGGLTRVEVISSEIDSANPDRARVKLRLHFKNGQSTDDTKLVKVKGKWMVDM